jgi:Spo0E like sporulation regulatory protein
MVFFWNLNVRSFMLKRLERKLAVSKQDLITLIEQKRQELIQVAMKNGFTSSLAIRNSQELDKLLNEYNDIFKKKVPTH